MFKRKRLIVWAVILAGVVFTVFYVRSRYVLPVIMYHSVLPVPPKGGALVVSSDTFDRQMAFLKNNRYNVIGLEDVRGYYDGKKRLPARSIAITFDDGYEDNYLHAFPILKKYNLSATIFIILSKVGKPGYLNWGQIREMTDSGLVVFGSHSLLHPFLPALADEKALREEIRGSKKAMEDKLGISADFFAYPLGRFNNRVEAEVRDAGYKLAVATNPGWRFSDKDIFAIKRLRISENCRNLFVFWFETSGYYNFIREIRQRNKK